MMAAFDARAVEDGAVGRVFVQHLTFEDAAVFEREMEDIPLRRVRHRIEPHDRRPADLLQTVADATKVAMTTMQTANPVERLLLRHLLHSLDT